MSSRNGRSKKIRNGKPKYQPLPDLAPDEFEKLKADIGENGLRVPIIEDEKGNVLDGHQRRRALDELGIDKYPTQIITGLTEEQKWHYALSVNIQRRHLNRAQKRSLIEQELKRRPDIANHWLAEIVGADTKTVQAVRKRLESTLEIPKLKKLRGKDGKQRAPTYNRIIANTPKEREIAQAVIAHLPGDGRVLDAVTAQRRAHRNQKRAASNGKPIKPTGKEKIRLYNCRFQNLEKEAGLRRASVDLIVTDIPYDKGFLPQLDDLGRFAKRVLKPQGLFVTYSGQFHLPTVIREFGHHLTYRWMMASVWKSNCNQIHPLQIASNWKPILIFSKAAWKNRKRWPDVSLLEKQDKDWHKCQQDLGEIEDLVRYFSNSRGLICDPCAGSFSTAVACRRQGRKFVGCDVDAECVEIGYKRLAEEG